MYFVQGADPVLRDREVLRLLDELLASVDRTLALEDHTIPDRRSSGDADQSDAPDSLDVPVFATVTNALNSPPFMTEYRVVVVRNVGNLTKEQAQWLAAWMETAPDSTRLVLVTGGGRMQPGLDKTAKALAQVVAPPTEQTAGVLAAELRDAQIELAPDASSRLAAHLGDDAARVPELIETFRSTYGPGATLALDDIEPYLGEVGTAGRFDLTNSIDRGDGGAALEVLHRILTATSAREPKGMHPMQIMASLTYHYQRLLRLDDPTITTKEQAAERLGMKGAGGARFPLEAARRLGTGGLREATQLLARAELDLRGNSGLDERTVIEILVARLAALTRRHQATRTTARPSRRGA
ncbi:MAG: DNA polymerase III subunit delta [Actinomycetota bacterium]